MSVQSDLRELAKKFPELLTFFKAVKGVTYPEVPDMPLTEAMVRVVNSQMLSTKAASAIFSRVQARAEELKLDSLADLSEDEFRSCGMSRGKVRSIHEFRDRFHREPQRYKRWYRLPFDQLQSEVDEIWGISTWTAEMLAMFYFGHQDVFPTKDLAINRGVDLIIRHLDKRFDPNQAQPHRTLLARCIWRSFDVGYWDGLES